MKIRGIKNRCKAKQLIKKLKTGPLRNMEIKQFLKVKHRFYMLHILRPLVKYGIILKSRTKKTGRVGTIDTMYRLGNYDINTLHKLGL